MLFVVDASLGVKWFIPDSHELFRSGPTDHGALAAVDA